MRTAFAILTLLLALYWEHDGVNCSGFIVEESTDLITWSEIDRFYIWPAWRTNTTDYTWRFELTNQVAAFYRVGAFPE